jgi:hypothetical protein
MSELKHDAQRGSLSVVGSDGQAEVRWPLSLRGVLLQR